MGLFNWLFGKRLSPAVAPPTAEAEDSASESTDAAKVDEAIQLIEGRHFKRAHHILRQVIRRVPPDYCHTEERDGKLYIRFWNLEEFIEYVGWMHKRGTTREVVWIANAYSRAAYYLGYVAIEEGGIADAIRYLDTGLRLEPDSGNLTHEKAQVLLKLGRTSEALSLIESQLAKQCFISPTVRAVLLRDRGYCQIEQGEFDHAEASYRESLALDPDSHNAQNQLKFIDQCRGGSR